MPTLKLRAAPSWYSVRSTPEMYVVVAERLLISGPRILSVMGVVRRTDKLYVVRALRGFRRPGMPCPEMSVCERYSGSFANDTRLIESGRATPRSVGSSFSRLI